MLACEVCANTERPPSDVTLIGDYVATLCPKCRNFFTREFYKGGKAFQMYTELNDIEAEYYALSGQGGVNKHDVNTDEAVRDRRVTERCIEISRRVREIKAQLFYFCGKWMKKEKQRIERRNEKRRLAEEDKLKKEEEARKKKGKRSAKVVKL